MELDGFDDGFDSVFVEYRKREYDGGSRERKNDGYRSLEGDKKCSEKSYKREINYRQ